MGRLPRPRGAPNPRLVTLTTDVGWAYAAQMKGVLYRSVTPGQVVDLVHDIPAHSVLEGAFLLRHLGATYPAGSVHLAVVDPGVGGQRAPIAIECSDGSYLVGPDNGVLLPLARHLGRPVAVRLDPRRIHPGRTGSRTFDGRDLFAPAGALLALGTPLHELGDDWVPQDGPNLEGTRTDSGGNGQVVHVDQFENLITTVPTEWLPPSPSKVRVRVGTLPARTLPVRETYEELSPGELGIVGSSFGLAELCVREGRAAHRLRARVGAAVNFAGPSRQRRPGRYRNERVP